MPLKVMCSKGCGEPVELSDDQVKEANRLGAVITAQHEVCPTDKPEAQQPAYRVLIQVFRYDPIPPDLVGTVSMDEWMALEEGDLLASFAGKVVAPSFTSGFDSLSKQLSELWEQVGKMRNVVEGGTPPSTT